MKKLAIGMVALMISLGAMAQAPVVSAYSYLKNGLLDKAKNQIDFAIKDDKCKDLAKTWFYRGNIYLSIYLSPTPKYKVLDTNALIVSYNSYQKALELDEKVMNENLNPYSPEVGLMVLADLFVNRGIDIMETKKYEDALANFEMSRKISRIYKINDTIATYGAALCYINLKDGANAKATLEELVKRGYHQGLVYTELANYEKAEGDTVKALATIKKGRAVMPQDLNLILAETSIYLGQGKFQEAQELLDLAVSRDPNNALLHYAIGVNMAEFNNFEAAEKAYNKAIELKSDYFDAIYNLGALYVNTAATIMETANKLPIGDPQYDIEKAKADKMLNDAIPVLEKAEILQPTDINTLLSLKNLYTRVGNAEKMKTVDEKIKNLKQ